MGERRTIREDRLAKGLCPQCGAEAAPYRLCGQCRFRGLIYRLLRKGEKAGEIASRKQGREKRVWKVDHNKKWTFSYNEVTDESDGRLRPKLRGIPVDVERQLIKIFETAGKPLTLDEIMTAWGTLRLRAGRTSAAMDLAYIVEAKRKRAAKMARRAERQRKQLVADTRKAAHA